MAASKKTNPKSKSSPAPATKAAPARKSVAPAKSAPKKKAADPAPVAVATKVATDRLVAIAVKAVVNPPASTSTLVTARIDVGFGNTLFIRGEGPGLSWEKGRPMNCVADDLWQIDVPASPRPCAVKFLVNDAIWSSGSDFVFASGESVTFAPEF